MRSDTSALPATRLIPSSGPTSPVGWEHIAFSGDFLWDRAAERTRRKPLHVADSDLTS